MNSRSFEIFKDGKYDSNNINEGMIIVEQLVKDIDIILEDYDLDDGKKEYLINSKKRIIAFLNKYEFDFSFDKKYYDEFRYLSNKFNLTDNEEKKLDIIKKIYFKKLKEIPEKKHMVLLPYYEQIFIYGEQGEVNAQEYYKKFYQELSECFDIEDQIHRNIVVPIWKDYISSIEDDFSQGSKFAYLLHSSNRFINLPGSENYHTNKDDENDISHKTSFISGSLITNNEMETGNSNVGILIRPKEVTILTASSSDCGTIENNERNVTNVKINEDGTCVSINFPEYEIPISKIGTPKKIERDAMQASINNTGEILNAGKWILPIYTEVVIDKRDFELDGIFFKTTGCDINLEDYIVAKQMEMYYGKKLRVVNQSIYRENNGLEPYTEEEKERFNKQLEFYSNPENYKMFEDNPVLYRNLIQSYYKEIVCGTDFKDETKTKIESVLVELIEYLNSFIIQNNIEDSTEIKLEDLMNIDLDNKSFPQSKYIPENIWGSAKITKKDIGNNFALCIPINLKEKVSRLLTSTEIQFERKGEEK
jgi:hypothetical protein